MLVQRNRRGRETPNACPRCSETPTPQLVHIEGLTFLCDRCLHEIHAEPRRRRTGRAAAVARGSVAGVAVLLTLIPSVFLKVDE